MVAQAEVRMKTDRRMEVGVLSRDTQMAFWDPRAGAPELSPHGKLQRDQLYAKRCDFQALTDTTP